MYKLNASDTYKDANQSALDTLTNKGWNVDRFGHATKVNDEGKKYRYKFQATTIRYEVQSKHDDGCSSWVRIRTLSYKKLK